MRFATFYSTVAFAALLALEQVNAVALQQPESFAEIEKVVDLEHSLA